MTLVIQPALDGAVLRLTLDHGKGNVIDTRLVAALDEAFTRAQAETRLRCVLLEAAGRDFSFGASVEEHRPAVAPAMLEALHRLLGRMLSTPLPLLAAVRGRCLGGGLELVLAASRVFAHPDARFACPEVKLGVIAPAASALLPHRIGPSAAEELLTTGRTIDAAEALRLGLVQELCGEAGEPSDAALAWAKANLFELSRSSLRFSVRAARTWVPVALRRLFELEQLYTSELMNTPDAVEGIDAFLSRRNARWSS